MEQVIIRPSSKKDELIFLLTTTAIIIILALVSIALRRDDTVNQKLKSYQINAFSDLETKEQLLFTSLYSAGYEIESYHMNNGEAWPSVYILEEQGVSPFVKDMVWRENGKVIWNQKMLGEELFHRIAYLGRSGNYDLKGRFLLVLEHLHDYGGTYIKSTQNTEPFRIWYTTKQTGGFPADYSVGFLIKNEWKEVVPYKGKDEAKKLGRGE